MRKTRKQLLTAEAIATELFGGCVTGRTVRSMTRREVDPMPCVRVAGHGDERSDRVWFDPEDVIAWLGRQDKRGEARA